jgi:hypothetical protein
MVAHLNTTMAHPNPGLRSPLTWVAHESYVYIVTNPNPHTPSHSPQPAAGNRPPLPPPCAAPSHRRPTGSRRRRPRPPRMSCSSTPSPYLLRPFTPSSLHPVMRRGRRLAVRRHRGRAATRRARAAAHQEGKHHRGARPPGAGGKRHRRSCCQWSTTTTPPNGDFLFLGCQFDLYACD